MFKASHTTLVALSGFVWLLIGIWLFSLGLNFIVGSLLIENANLNHPLIDFFSSFSSSADVAALILILLALIVGYVKGKFIFAKTVQKSVDRIIQLPNPVSIGQIYTIKYYILLASMMFLGIIVRFTPSDVRGTIDMIIGCALIMGAFLYFKEAFMLYKADRLKA